MLRKKNGYFKSFKDFCEKIDSRKIKKSQIELLIYSGAFDCFGVPRKRMRKALDEVLKAIQDQKKKSRKSVKGQTSLLSLVKQKEKTEQDIDGLGFDSQHKKEREWNKQKMLQKEKEALGIFLSSNPLLEYSKQIVARSDFASLEECHDLEDNKDVVVPCMISNIKKINDSKNREMAFIDLEDFRDEISAVMFFSIYDEYKNMLSLDTPLVICGKINEKQDKKNIIINKIYYLSNYLEDTKDNFVNIFKRKDYRFVKSDNNSNCNIYIDYLYHKKDAEWIVAELKKICQKYKGKTNLHIVIQNVPIDNQRYDVSIHVGPDFRIDCTSEFLDEVETFFENISLVEAV